MTKKINRRERLEKQLEAIKTRLQAVKAREKTSDRKKDIRRKILVGSYYIDQAEKNNSMDKIKNLMDNFLKRDFDREIFGLKPLQEQKEKID